MTIQAIINRTWRQFKEDWEIWVLVLISIVLNPIVGIGLAVFVWFWLSVFKSFWGERLAH